MHNKAMLFEPELILDAHADLGEGPVWEPRSGCLYWVDIHAGHLHIFNPREGMDSQVEVGEFIGCAAPRRSNGLVLGLRSGFAFLDLTAEKLTRIVNPETHLPGNRFNDGKCDPAGRFLAGSMDDAEIEPSGSLYSLSPNGQVKTLLTGTCIANGLAWSPDYLTFYFINTPNRTVMAYDYDLATGAIANPRLVISVPPALGWPDGMTSDTQGQLWVAIWGGAKLTRWNPASGQLLEEIPFPELNVSSCAFGGPHLTDLYVTNAPKEMHAEQLAKYPLSGGLFRIRTDIEGLPTFSFGG
jgi:sugar lactone lactonase YvrE